MSSFLLKLGDMRFPVRLGETLIGRSPYCSIVLADARVSRQHTAIRLTAAGLCIEDLGSRNGTRVNGKLLREKSTLRAGDIVQIGDQRLEVELVADAAIDAKRPLAETGDYTTSRIEGETPTEPGTTSKPSHRASPLGLPRVRVEN